MTPTNRLLKWKTIVEKKSLDLTQPINYVDASEIKSITGEEPRLMAKIDRYEDLPEIFKKHNVFILPVTNYRYAIIKGKGYHSIGKYPSDHKCFQSRLSFDLATMGRGVSEMQYIDYAYNCGLIENFARAGNLYLTIRGRKYSPRFSFRVDGSPTVETESVQVEVDAGFEAKEDIIVVEGKMGKPDNFIIRQLYYPYRFWDTILPDKKVTPVFFCFEDERYFFWEYRFKDKFDYESIELVRSKSYEIQLGVENVLSLADFEKIEPKKEKRWTIPQADDLRKILEFPFRVAEGMNNSTQIAEYFEFTGRQSSYYREATEALGLVVLRNNTYHLTDVGQAYVSLPVQKRHELFCRLLFELPIMNRILVELFIKPSKSISRDEVAKIIKEHSHLTGATPGRRAQTVLAWFRWIQEGIGIISVAGGKIALPTWEEKR